MRMGCGLAATLLASSLVGCVAETAVQSTALLKQYRPSHGPAGPDVIQMDIALVEGPVGDRFFNEELWTLADDQVIDLERNAVLEENGLRIGQVGGIPPAGLQERLTSERSCATARRFRLHAGEPTPVNLGPPIEHCRFDIHQNGETTPVNLEHAECVLVVVPTLTSDGKTRLQFTPQIKSGKPERFYAPTTDRTGWMVEDQQPTAKFSDLSWEVALEQNEYVVVGARFDRPDTIGHRLFIRGDEPAPRQRLLVIRTGRSMAGVAADEDFRPTKENGGSHPPPPLAFRAAWTALKGNGP